MSLPQRFFLIDDNPHDQLLAQEAFGELCPDCHLTVASDGPEALSLLGTADTLPDVILLDVNMPRMNGFEVLQALKGNPRLKLIPVVMLSTSDASADITAAYTLYASSYLVKADDFGAFLKQIEAFLTYWRGCHLTAPT
ncbi:MULTISPECIES: response regulator [Deinococcus]|uniref:response regulator n=1 Tax=Deinococcus TaxID=1298 RepID=UPI0016679CBE|nr:MULTISPECIES: response regulator [Deinococcus]MDK2014686.1 response regulator [Deinococcus sp. 43]GGB82505.1 response regulator [Deinococcus soli (ex Cha et al. 2016)]